MKKIINPTPSKPCHGFTLVELMVTLAVLGILVTIAVPSFQNMILSNRMAGVANDLSAALAYARSQAVTKQRPITACASSNGTACSGLTAWQNGWVVLDGVTVLRVQEALGGTTTLNGAATIVFDPTGRMTSSPAATVLTLCPGRAGVQGREIQVEVTGRSGVKKITTCP